MQNRIDQRLFSNTMAKTGLLLSLSGLAVAASAQRPPELTRSLSGVFGGQGRLMWIDGTANLYRTVDQGGKEIIQDLTTTKEGVAAIVRRCKAAHINTLVVDIKPLSGQVLYNSRIAPHMTAWKGHPIPDFDVLAAFIEEGHKAGLQIDASINTLSEGHKYFQVGLAYQHPDWQSIVYTVDRGLFAPDGARLSVHAPGEPDDPDKPTLLAEDTTILGGAPNSGMIGLESTDKPSNIVGGDITHVPLGRQLNITLDADNHVTGILDSSLLGDEPLVAPEEGRLITATRESDRTWIAQHLHGGAQVRFDMRTLRMPITQAPSERVSCFVNPLNQEARRHELDVVREIVTNYDIDGFVLDRCRFSNLNNDFSDLTREAFSRWLGRSINHWPEDIFTFAPTPGDIYQTGPLFKPWLEFRAQVIRDFVAEIASIVRSVKPHIALGTYVGSWYPSYFEVGVNWGSEKTDLRYSWFTQNYPQTGYADFFDWISTGCYYPIATAVDARRQGASTQGTVEYAAGLSSRAVANAAFVYPGLYVPDYINRPDAFLRGLDAASKNGEGWMIFDMSYIDKYNWWPLLEQAYPKDAPAPSTLPDVLAAARSAMDGSR